MLGISAKAWWVGFFCAGLCLSACSGSTGSAANDGTDSSAATNSGSDGSGGASGDGSSSSSSTDGVTSSMDAGGSSSSSVTTTTSSGGTSTTGTGTGGTAGSGGDASGGTAGTNTTGAGGTAMLPDLEWQCDDRACVPGAACDAESGNCECAEGFEGDGWWCLSSAPCDAAPCENGGTCHPTLGQRYLCTCPEGFGGVHCEIDCSGEIDFPDAAFEAAVRSAAFIDDGIPLTAETLADVTSLTISDTTISDLTGIECIPSLSWLSLYEVGLVDLAPLAALPRLTSLNATCNSISDLSPLQNLINLTTLDIGKGSSCIDLPGQVTDLSPLADLVGLATLGLAGQDTDSLAALEKLTHLDFLVLANNERLASLAGLENAAHLEYVVFSDTLVSDVSLFAGHPTLQTLYLSGSPVSDLTPLVTAGALESLYVVATQVDCTEQAENLATLQSNGVQVSSDCD